MVEIDKKQVKNMYFKKHIRIGEISQKTGIRSKELLPILGFLSWDEYHYSRQKQRQKIQNKERSKIKKLKPQIIEKYNGKCFTCYTKKNLHIHHIVPMSKGGKSELDNLMLVCNKCHIYCSPLKNSKRTYPRLSKRRKRNK